MTLAWTFISRGAVVLIISLLSAPFGPAGCSDEGSSASGGKDAACPSGEVRSKEGECACPAGMVPLAAGGCQPAGLPVDMACPPGEMQLPSGGCEPAGIAPEACAEGFEPDGKRGCNAIQPEDDCPEGLMAIPGETKCREVAPCGSGTWGDIPVEADTQFVDGSYSGGGSDGTKEKPWLTIQIGVVAAAEGAIVAVAAGSYNENILINHKAVRLWGRCPAMVEVVGAKSESPAIRINDSYGTEVRALAVGGSGDGLSTHASKDVIADQVWVHPTGEVGVYVEGGSGPAAMTVRSSLIEGIIGLPVVSEGASLTLEESVVRDTALSNRTFAGVIAVEFAGERGDLKIRGSVISRTHRFGVYVYRSSAEIDATLIRDILPLGNGTDGTGVLAALDGHGDAAGDLTIRASVIEDTRSYGVLTYGPGLTIESTVVRGTRPDEDGHLGRGIVLQEDSELGQGSMTIRGSVVEDNTDIGIGVLASEALIEGTVVRDTKEGMDDEARMGVIVQSSDSLGSRGSATIRSSVIQRNVASGIAVMGSDATIETSIIADTMPDKEGIYGSGIVVHERWGTLERASAIVRSCLIERTSNAGVAVVSSDVTIETSYVRDVKPNAEGTFGDGIVVVVQATPASAHLYGTRFEASARAGIMSAGGHIVMDRIAVACGAIDINGESYNGTDFIFDDRGGTVCGCPAASDRCHVQSAGLQPPSAIAGF